MRRHRRFFAARLLHLGELGMVAAGASVGGAVVAYLLDPDRGHARRARLADELEAQVRARTMHARRAALREVHHLIDPRLGMLRARQSHMVADRQDVDDATLAQKVRSEVLGHLDRDLRSRVLIDVADGVVHVRGEVTRGDDRVSICADVGHVRGVRGVENLMHGPGEEPPNKADVLRLLHKAS